MFADRVEAGRRLAVALAGSVRPGALVLGVPRGGVVVAAEVARAHSLELDVIVVRKIGAPGNPEYAVGAVDEDGHVVGGRSALVSDEYLAAAAAEGRAEIARRLAAYRGNRPAPRIAGRAVLVVDDGIATGFTLLAALESLRSREAGRLVVAAPVAAPDAAQRIAEMADEFVALEVPRWFSAVGQFYRDFSQTPDAEVMALLKASRVRT
ncbi:MAG: phosphoribosyltransferase [Actinobacteria bacterium]|nr:phosphoribosyltransferase [Actinomycetota bacterium]